MKGRVVGVLKYSTVFVYDENSALILSCHGFGAKRLLVPEFDPRSCEIEQNSSSALILLDEEAYYLVSKNILVVSGPDAEPIDESSLWTAFSEHNRRFALKFKVYEHFRELGFVVKTGVHYGVDYAVYRSVPAVCHSELCVLVMDGTGATSTNRQTDEQLDSISCRHLSTLTRVMPDVMKTLLLCYVVPVVPEDACSIQALKTILSTPQLPLNLASAACLSLLEVRPVTSAVRRLPAKSDLYQTAGQTQSRYRSMSVLTRPRVQRAVKKRQRKRRNPSAARFKNTSKHQALWKELNKEEDSEIVEDLTTHRQVKSVNHAHPPRVDQSVPSLISKHKPSNQESDLGIVNMSAVAGTEKMIHAEEDNLQPNKRKKREVLFHSRAENEAAIRASAVSAVKEALARQQQLLSTEV